ncbi:MAG: PaaI family thioesterase [Nitrospirota bacterium]
MKKFILDDDGYCFVCGKKNKFGLNLEFRTENGRTHSEFIPKKIHQGFKDIVHGGIISTILDEAMMKAVLSLGIEAVTAEINIRLKIPLFVGEKALIDAGIEKIGNRLIETSAKITKNNTTIVAEAHAKLIRNA